MTDPETFKAGVSRETLEMFNEYLALLKKWNPRINLVAKGEINHLWERHLIDSAQIFQTVDQPVRTWLDLGSGGGFPGIVCAILAHQAGHDCHFELVESDKRKAIFLEQVSRALSLPVTVLAMRIETLNPSGHDVISARALAALDVLLQWAYPHATQTTQMLFLKGRNAESELTSAARSWHMKAQRIPSQTSSDGVVLKLTEVHPQA